MVGFLDSIAKPKATTFRVVERVTELRPTIGKIQFHVEEVVSTIRVGSMPAEDAEPEPKTISVPAYNVPEINDDSAIAALLLIAGLDPDTLAQASKLDEKINLEDLAALLSDAAILALE